ncbi:MAG TPA: glycosyltransferase family 9 protein [Chitinivibrionales bacterium]|nr:glycosyltransferase family 9 protein [Chitinivibrionales bacterium]
MKILIVQIGRIGDMVLTTPLFRAVAEHVPGAEMHVLSSPRGAPVLRGNPRVKKIFVYRKDPFSFCSLMIRLLLTRYDWLIDPKDHASRESALLAGICRAKNKVGFNREGESTFSFPIPSDLENAALHAVARNLACLKPLGMPSTADPRPELFPDARLVKKIKDTILVDDAKTVALNISAGDSSRYWTVEGWAAVAAYCLSKNLRVIVTYKPADGPNAGKLQNLQPRVILYDSPAIGDIVALISLVNLVVTPDTSVVHVASAFDVPQVALFPDIEWNLEKFRPLSRKSVVLQQGKGEAVSTITPDRVVSEIEKMLEKA